MRKSNGPRARIIPDVIREQRLVVLDRNDTIRAAIDAMARHVVDAVLTVDASQRPEGIFTERDVIMHVLADDVDIERTPLHSVATAAPRAVSPGTAPGEALHLMRQGQYRHLPIVDDDRVIGIVSMRDLYDFVLRSVDDDILKVADIFIRDAFKQRSYSKR
jgi:CBS domain-containing protein